ncbi:uncharacterized protein CLUP02_00214 [Colletotrichum lupini]|uniref:Uncharacterized protein n=1 Tax=Colletotrichum lupini TaxID=145971 RepID=A0A9Q8W7T1_9PEZI|nr:uncharacterized protein CLUP02_00214 [Colletotrichum lupini]UQC73569.1 hypothetical protein CLUP02_00214 [Colletotrichum lupini]
MFVFAVSRSQLLSADMLEELRYKAKMQYHQAHVLDLASCEVDLEDHINGYIEGYCKQQTCATTSSSSVSLASNDTSTKSKSRLRRLLHRITGKKL